MELLNPTGNEKLKTTLATQLYIYTLIDVSQNITSPPETTKDDMVLNALTEFYIYTETKQF